MLKEEIKKLAEKLYPEIQTYRRRMHSNPELSFQEFETSKFIFAELKKLKIQCEIVADTGVVGRIGDKSNYIALRADIDALPIMEETGLEYKSQKSGVMHACGHDIHSAILLGVAKILKELQKHLKVGVMLIFQPGEEVLPGGAEKMIKAGIFSKKPIAIFGQHIDPEVEVGKFAFAEGTIMASGDEIYWKMKGKRSHAAQPHLGNDPLKAAVSIINQLQSSINIIKDPLSPVVFSITSINTFNDAVNVLPDRLNMQGILRTYNERLREHLVEKIKDYTNFLCSQFGISVEVNVVKGYPALNVEGELVKFAQNNAVALFGKTSCVKLERKLWTEDFARYAEIMPACFWFLGGGDKKAKEVYGLHSSKFNPNEKAMFYGTALLSSIALNFSK